MLHPLQRPVGAGAVGPARAAGWCCRATASACARSSTRVTGTGSPSPPRSRRCSPTRPCRAPSTPIGLDEVLTYWSTVAPPHGVRRHRAAAARPRRGAATATASGSHPYWSIDFPDRGAEPGQDIETNAAELRERLVEAARLRFVRSDVPVGAYLSGGIDSAITAAVDRAVHRRAAAHVLAAVRRRGVRRGRSTSSKMVGRAGHRSTRRSSSPPADIAEVFPEVVWHAETPVAAHRARAAVPAVAAGAGQRLQGRGDGRGRRRGARRLRHLPGGPGARSSGPATRARPRATARSSCSTRGWRATPAPAPAFARSFFGQRPRRRRPRHVAPPAVGLHQRAQGDAGRPTSGPSSTRGPRTSCRRDAGRQRRLGPAAPRPVVGDDDAAARLHPGLARATGC